MIKRISSIFIVIIMSMYCFVLPASAYTYTTADAMNVLQAVAGVRALTAEQLASYEISGAPSTADALRILRIVAGLPSDSGSDAVEDKNPQTDEMAEFAAKVLSLVNIERANYGIAALSCGNALLNQAAMIRAAELIDKFSHTRPDGSSCFSAYTDLGGAYRRMGENIAYGQSSPQAVVDAWMKSDGHRRNILNPDFTYLGVGVAKSSSGRLYWVQLFCG
jgi:uncharacterized protein YkwD